MANSNNNAATIVEEEAPHEIYASLVEMPNSRRYAAVDFRPAYIGTADLTHQRRNSNSNGIINRGIHQQHEGGGANLITTGIVEQCAEEPSTSQFINFYRKSCETKQYDCNSGGVGGVGKKRASKATNKHSVGAAATALHNTNQAETTATATSTSNIQYNNAASRTGNKSYSSKAATTTTTKSERRRIAKREQERQIQKEKRIRMMLRSDFTEEDELLYRCLHR